MLTSPRIHSVWSKLNARKKTIMINKKYGISLSLSLWEPNSGQYLKLASDEDNQTDLLPNESATEPHFF